MRFTASRQLAHATLHSGRTALTLAVLIVSLAAAGCDRGNGPAPPATSATQPAKTEKPQLTLITTESTTWPRDEALQRLADEEHGVSAAVRLVRLADAWPLCVPETLTDVTVSRLRVVLLSENTWALGFADRRSDRVLRAPVLIGADGSVTVVADGTEEETLELHVSPDADVFPHLLITPMRVLIVAAELQLALTLDSPPIVGFQWRQRDGFSYVGLMLRGEGGWIEVAQYQWEPFELALVGPASDALPDPPGGKFALDMDASPLLIPMGGEIPEPKPRKQEPPPDFRPGWDEV